MDYLGDYKDYRMWRNNDGCIEFWKSKGKKISVDENTVARSDVERVVTLYNDTGQAIKYLDGLKPKPIRIKKEKLPPLFNE